MFLIQLPLRLSIVTLLKLILQQGIIMGHFLVFMQLLTLGKILTFLIRAAGTIYKVN